MCEFCDRLFNKNLTEEERKVKGIRNGEFHSGWTQSPLRGLDGNIVEDMNVTAYLMNYKTYSPTINITLEVTERNRLLEPMIGETGFATIHIPVKYCPFCGEKLKGAKYTEEKINI